MHFPNGIADAKDQVREWTGRAASRHVVECALDFLISVEPDDDMDYDKNFETTLQRYSVEFAKVGEILKAYGNQISPRTLAEMQNQFYSFSNLPKYRFTATTIGVVRDALCRAWEGINGWSN
jgi:hypothetical protein